MSNREEQQQKAVEAILENYKIANPLVKATMRFGKTKVVLDAIAKIIEQELIENPQILVLVPGLQQKESWIIEINKWYNGSSDDFIISTYHSISKFTYHEFDFIVFDEIHRMTERAWVYAEKLLNNENTIAIAITGTLPRQKTRLELLAKNNFKEVFTLEIEDAIEMKIVNNFDIHVVKVPLSQARNILVETRRKTSFYTSEYNQYKYLTRLVELNPSKHNLLKRANFLYNLTSKAHAAKVIKNGILISGDENKVLIFTKRTNIADYISPYTIHNGNSDEVNDINLQKFINGDIRELAAVEKINEGVTIPNVTHVIIESFDSNAGRQLQRIGRGLTKSNKIEKVKVIIIVSKDTKEEKWLEDILPNREILYYIYVGGQLKRIDYDRTESKTEERN